MGLRTASADKRGFFELCSRRIQIFFSIYTDENMGYSVEIGIFDTNRSNCQYSLYFYLGICDRTCKVTNISWIPKLRLIGL